MLGESLSKFISIFQAKVTFKKSISVFRRILNTFLNAKEPNSGTVIDDVCVNTITVK